MFYILQNGFTFKFSPHKSPIRWCYWACFSDGSLMQVLTAMCESGHCRDKVWLFCLHLSVMIAVVLSHLVTKWVIVMSTKGKGLSHQDPNKYFSLQTGRCQFMWSLKNRFLRVPEEVQDVLPSLSSNPCPCIFNVLLFPPLQTSSKFSTKLFSLTSCTSCLPLFQESHTSLVCTVSKLVAAGFSFVFILPPAFPLPFPYPFIFMCELNV